ncbi:unnamed protein product [Scytosiphon promiscuus]
MCRRAHKQFPLTHALRLLSVRRNSHHRISPICRFSRGTRGALWLWNPQHIHAYPFRSPLTDSSRTEGQELLSLPSTRTARFVEQHASPRTHHAPRVSASISAACGTTHVLSPLSNLSLFDTLARRSSPRISNPPRGWSLTNLPPSCHRVRPKFRFCSATG